MNSGSHRGFTVVTIMTLVFGPVFSHHDWVYKLISKTQETKTVPCVVDQPCPAKSMIVNVVTLPAPQDPPPGTGDGDKGGNGGKKDPPTPKHP